MILEKVIVFALLPAGSFGSSCCASTQAVPLEITGGLTFDPQTKSIIRRDVLKPEEKAATLAKQKELYKKAKTEWEIPVQIACRRE